MILAQLTQAGAKVLTVDGADLSSAADDPTRTLIRQVLSAVAQLCSTTCAILERVPAVSV